MNCVLLTKDCGIWGSFRKETGIQNGKNTNPARTRDTAQAGYFPIHFRDMFSISLDSSIPPITMKKFRRSASVKDRLKGSPYAEQFAGGTFTQYYLSGPAYHRFHSPVSGVLKESRVIPGVAHVPDGGCPLNCPLLCLSLHIRYWFPWLVWSNQISGLSELGLSR